MTSLRPFEEEFSLCESLRVFTRLSAALLPAHHRFNRWIKAEDWSALANASVDYTDHLDASTVRAERQVLAFFTKNAGLPLDIDRRAVAREKMDSAERQCRVTNWKLRNRSFDSNFGIDSSFLLECSRKIGMILGPCPEFDDLPNGFGPGSNVGTLKNNTSVRKKLSVRPTYTTSAERFVEPLLVQSPTWDYLNAPRESDFGKLAFVPKDAKTDRTIEMQPIINAYIQKGVGTYMKQRLLAAGCDLYKGHILNGEYARLGSLYGTYATIDLSSASDTISSMLVLELLPNDWLDLLCDLRTSTLKDGSRFRNLERFSAMGNGFTFELESLLFYAILRVVCGDSFCHAYGDDLIVPTEHAAEVIRRLEMCGFVINITKSYVSGPFRESCGKDFFDGVDVRPVYAKGLLSYRELFRLHNFFFRRGSAYLADIVKKFIPRRFSRVTGPDGFGDGHLLSWTPNLLPHGRKDGYSGWIFKTYAKRTRVDRKMARGDYGAFLYLTDQNPTSTWWAPSIQASKQMYSERGGVEYRLIRVYTLVG